MPHFQSVFHMQAMWDSVDGPAPYSLCEAMQIGAASIGIKRLNAISILQVRKCKHALGDSVSELPNRSSWWFALSSCHAL